MSIKRMHLGLIRRTKNPIAPLAMQQLADGIQAMASVLTLICRKEEVEIIQQRLLSSFNDEEVLNKQASSAEWILALLAMLSSSCKQFTNESQKQTLSTKPPTPER